MHHADIGNLRLNFKEQILFIRLPGSIHFLQLLLQNCHVLFMVISTLQTSVRKNEAFANYDCL